MLQLPYELLTIAAGPNITSRHDIHGCVVSVWYLVFPQTARLLQAVHPRLHHSSSTDGSNHEQL